MAPIKFEEHLKEKLEQRTITPSNDAWDKLSSQLDNSKKKNNKATILWLGIAASFIGVLLMFNLFFNNSDEKINTEIVDTKNEVITPSEEQNNSNNNNNVVVPIKNEDAVEITKMPSEEKIVNNIFKVDSKQPKTNTINVGKQKPLFMKENSTNLVINNTNEVLDVKEETLNVNVVNTNEVVIETRQPENKTKAIDAEVDTLLKGAQQNILFTTLQKSSEFVDANSLLEDVENDTENSFRGKLFNKIKSSYDVVKTAVSDRNN